MDFFGAGGHFGSAAAIDDGANFGAEAFGGSDGVHRGVAAADDADAFAADDWRVGVGVVGLHKVCAGEVFVGGIDAFEIFAGDVHKFRQSCADGDEDGLEALIGHQLGNCYGPSDDDVGFDGNAEGLEVAYFGIDDFLGHTEFGDAVNEDAAGFVECLENGYVVAEFG